ncbi:MAG: long-chain fatty acid--CoA ligase [Acidobacteria bacterium]|jgi:long-chain acyl-CoA synthetase|nr:long-chain fatty acid--CoA ligase [Thermoanaerobaculia bacterium]MDI9630945.1 long-chain fatty acid--CoA ligase [Acidobacteriota bacterium]OQC42171.1 MAG: Long-chain-fatty-acid--CoA ligase FadD15 [Acidobacteria bacterium ADurb.Bin051]MBP7812360.1 long-chain fatty acid--CoA ligase [Thermoanaerobaculia bacterium]MBP8844578.1 long-chain fatty acid--CoA ligase [Thermoanaerobaculia bacterium]
MSIRTLAELLAQVAARQKPDLLLHKVDGSYRPISTAEFMTGVLRLSHALGRLGVARGDRVALMAENSPSWPTVDFATIARGAALVPIYPTLLPEQAAYIARDSGSKVLFVQGRERLEGLLAQKPQMPATEQIVWIDGDAPGDGYTTLALLLEQGRDADPATFDAGLAATRPEDLATLIYTSGTTGDPKGVMLSHSNLVSNVVTGTQVLALRGDYTVLSFLPLSHSLERTVDYCYFYCGCTIAYAESIQTVAQNLLEVRPHVFVAVPRVYEKVQSRVMETAAAGSAVKQRIFSWALDVGRRALPYRLQEKPAPGLLGLELAAADRLVFGKIRERLGGRFIFAISGGAPLPREVAEFFWGAGIRLFEGYGLTETSPVISVNAFSKVKLGTVGQPLPDVEVRIAEDGEILARGPNIMQGYFGQPEATAEMIDEDGWLHSGDIGHLDADGFLAITDRKKELIVNAYGKNIAPAPIENALKASRFISQAVVIGDRRQFLVALLVPDFETLVPWAEKQGLPTAPAELVATPQVRDLVREEVEAINTQLARYEQVRNWALLPAEFTLETGELTPTQKVKRRVVNEKYGEIIERLYREGETAAGA